MTTRSATSALATRARPSEAGVALIVALWISLGLASLALVFGHTMMLEHRAADNGVASLEAAHAVEGIRAYVEYSLANAEEPGRTLDPETYEAEELSVGDATAWLIGREGGGIDDSVAEEDEPVFGLVDEAAKLNLNTATVEMLELLPRMTMEFAAAIVDWRDEDDEMTQAGAESETYLLEDPPRYCKNAPFETVEELRLVAGAELEILHGEDINRNGVLDPNENDGDVTWPDDNQDGQIDPGILDLVTVHSREPNVREDGSDRIDVTSQNSQELNQLLEEEIGADRASAVQAAVGNGGGSIASVLQWYARSGLTPDEFAKVDGALTVSDEDVLEGLVNVNTASREVLACLPGIGETYAGQLVDYRKGKQDELLSLAWVTNVLDEAASTEAGPYLTTRTYQPAADIAAVGHEGRGFCRVFYVFDMTGEEPVVVDRRNRTGLGWPLGRTVRAELLGQQESKERIR